MDTPVPDKKNRSVSSPLRMVCIVGFILLLVVGGIFCFLKFYSEGNFFSRTARDSEAFYQGLEAFDAMLLESENFEKPEILNRVLDKLEKKVLGVESHLSLLKRRRFLAYKDARFIRSYQRAAEAAAKAIPFSEPLAAIAAEALLLEDPAISEKTAEQLRNYAFRLAEAKLKPIALSLYILVGDMQDALKAVVISNKAVISSTDLSFLEREKEYTDSEQLRTKLSIDLALLRIADGDITGVTNQINTMLQNPPASGHSELMHFAAEFFYDYGNPLKAAELFSQFSDEKSMNRQADALWLSGHIPAARNIWTILFSSNTSEPQNAGSLSEIEVKSLYNLAATETDKAEEASHLKRLLAAYSPGSGKFMGSSQIEESYYIYGIIRYTRLVDTLQSITLLTKEQFRQNLLLDLELLKRQGELWSLGKTVAETWLLLNRYPEEPRMYQWGCYFFDFQKQYDETALLIKNARYRNITGLWLEIHDSLRFIREGRLEEGEQRLTSLSDQESYWQIPANIARILEARENTAAALQYYETAAALVTEKTAAAQIQFRIGHCLRILNRDQESRQALEQAIQFNPDYPAARLELRRLNSQGSRQN